MLQVAGQDEALQAIALVASGTDIRQAQYKQEFKLVQNVVPFLAYFLFKLPFGIEIPADVYSLLSQLRDLVIAPFCQTSSSSHLPPSLVNSKLSFYPNLPIVRTSPLYVADLASRNGAEEQDDSCPTNLHSTPLKIFSKFLSPLSNIIYDNSYKLYALNRQLLHYTLGILAFLLIDLLAWPYWLFQQLLAR